VLELVSGGGGAVMVWVVGLECGGLKRFGPLLRLWIFGRRSSRKITELGTSSHLGPFLRRCALDLSKSKAHFGPVAVRRAPRKRSVAVVK
jgi:hypothetical protein